MTFGVGSGNYRLLAEGMLVDLPHLRADNNPHNFYLQLLAEKGILGAVTGTLFLWSIVGKCFQVRSAQLGDIVVARAFIVPFGTFWPIATTANIFGQWNDIFMWSAVALAIAAVSTETRN